MDHREHKEHTISWLAENVTAPDITRYEIRGEMTHQGIWKRIRLKKLVRQYSFKNRTYGDWIEYIFWIDSEHRETFLRNLNSVLEEISK